MNRRSWVQFIVVGIVWGFPYLFIRIAIRDLAPETMIFFRCAITLVALLPLAMRQRRLDLVLRHWFAIVTYTIIEIAIPWYLLARAEARVPSSVAGLLIATVPIFGLILAVVYRSERRISPVRVVGLLIGLGGVIVTIGIDIHGISAFSVIEIMICSFGYALGPMIFSQYLLGIPPVTVIASSFAIGTAIYLPFGLLNMPSHVSLETVMSVLALALVCSVTGFILFFRLISDVGPARATVVTYLNPIVAVIAGVLVLGEPFSNGLEFGLPLVIIGSILATWASARERSQRVERKRVTSNPQTPN
ncbi:MAG TPA: DMT family transporter [Acidimicrobiales bacterium]|nr:DMT family transporter [Acidimicrobiales bacterium]